MILTTTKTTLRTFENGKTRITLTKENDIYFVIRVFSDGLCASYFCKPFNNDSCSALLYFERACVSALLGKSVCDIG